jgi:hypothetical protein
MRIREYTSADLDALKRLHAAQGFGYPFPDLDSPLLITKLVLEEDSGEISMAALLRLTAEAFLLHDPRGGVSACRGGACLRPSGDDAIEKTAQASAFAKATADERVPVPLTPERLNRDAPRERWQRLLAMHEAVRRDAAARGLEDAQAFLPPRVARAFGRRLARLGWRRDPWPCYCRSVREL